MMAQGSSSNVSNDTMNSTMIRARNDWTMNFNPIEQFKLVPLYNGQNLSEWKSAIVDVLTALGVKHYIDRVYLDTDPEFDNYIRIGAFMRLTFEFKFKKAIEKYRSPYHIYEYTSVCCRPSASSTHTCFSP